MNSSLCGNIQFSSSSFKRENCCLHDSLVEKGWTEFLSTRVETIERVRPRAVFFHTFRGLKQTAEGKIVQNFAQRQILRETGKVNQKIARLENSLTDLFDVVRKIKELGTLVFAYEGVVPDNYTDFSSDALIVQARHELCCPLTGEMVFDGVILDGGSKMVPQASANSLGLKPDSRGRLADAIDGGLQPRFPTGNEAQAVDGRADLMCRPQFTLAGEVDPTDADKWRMDTGSFDPENTVQRQETFTRLHKKFTPLKSLSQGGGNHFVLDLFNPKKDLTRYKNRQRMIAELGCHVVMQVEHLDQNSSWITEGVRF